MKELILHIGSHKTATTSIQKFLLENNAELKSKGYSLFTLEPNGSDSLYGHANHWVEHSGYNENFSAKFNLDWVNQIKKLEELDTLIFSAEHLSWIFDFNEIRKIGSYLKKYFKSIKIVCYIRRQDEQLLSHHQQGSKHHDWCEQRYYGDSPSPLPDTNCLYEYLDYYTKLSMWGEVFGNDNVIIRPFEKEQLVNADIISDFISTCKLPLTPKKTVVNESNDKGSTIIGHILNNAGISHLDEKRIFIMNNVNVPGKLLCSRESAQKVFEQYKLSNLYLNNRFNISPKKFIFNEDFSKYPKEDLIKNDYIEIIKELLNLVISKTNYLNDKDFFALKDLAIKLGGNNAEDAVLLAKIVANFRKKPTKLKELIKKLDR